MVTLFSDHPPGGEEYEWDGVNWHFARVVGRVIHDRLGYPIGD